MKYFPLEIGMTFFFEESEYKFIAKPYKFILLPSRNVGTYITFDADTLNFLIEKGFDLSKMVKNGIAFREKEEISNIKFYMSPLEGNHFKQYKILERKFVQLNSIPENYIFQIPVQDFNEHVVERFIQNFKSQFCKKILILLKFNPKRVLEFKKVKESNHVDYERIEEVEKYEFLKF